MRREEPADRRQWRSLEELAGSEAFRQAVENEFPSEASVWDDPVSRRRFLNIMGASIALAGLSSCVKQPDEKILPYVRQPEYLVPGKPLAFATAFQLDGFATGILVTSHMGRPTGIGGNPGHPASLGSAGTVAAASILDLYDPDRSQVVRQNGEIATQDAFLQALAGAVDAQRALGGSGLRILTGTVTSPTLSWQIETLLGMFPKAAWHRHEPAGLVNEREGARLAFGEPVQPVYHFDRADVVFSLDADFMAEGPAQLRYARQFASRRKVSAERADLNRLYVAESFPSVTGGVADHRLPVRASAVAGIAGRLAADIGIPGARGADLPSDERFWVAAAAADLKNARGASIVIAGPGQPPEVHALAHRLNDALGNNGKTVEYLRPAESGVRSPAASLAALVEDLQRGEVDLLVIADVNPVFDAPADLHFASALTKARMSVSLGLQNDETARACTWHVPLSHYLETWSDTRSFDGTASIVQPLIAPLYNGISVHELLSEIQGKSGRKGYDIVREYWKTRGHQAAAAPDFEEFWRASLSDGVIPGTASAPLTVAPVPLGDADAPGRRRAETAAFGPRISYPGSHIEIMFRPDPTIGDGRFANNGWLQELPKPVTKLTWDNAAFLSPSLAVSLGVHDEDLVEVSVDGARCVIPALILPGHPRDSVTLHYGYGRKHTGRVGAGTGVDVYPLRTSRSLSWATGSIGRSGGTASLARTQDHHSMAGRPIYRSATAAEYRSDPGFAGKDGHAPGPAETLHPPKEYDGYKWGMTIDLNACTGCNACVIACQSENNIPIVGKDQVLNGREMHWIRIDRYYQGDLDDPEILSMPVACMHCENAPCEPVCPVAATSHDSEGLNVMTYNRCVGTRYCSNNCPYKVRRFNFLQYAETSEPAVLRMNPDVTVRNRGVMEKCTYCVQRISAARIEAKKENREIGDGEVVTACQSACPAQAIVFGDLNDPTSAISKSKAQPRAYGLLTELNTHPRTSYLARVTNPNPILAGIAAPGSAGTGGDAAETGGAG